MVFRSVALVIKSHGLFQIFFYTHSGLFEKSKNITVMVSKMRVLGQKNQRGGGGPNAPPACLGLSEISGYSPCKDCNFQFTTVLLKTLSDQLCGLMLTFFQVRKCLILIIPICFPAVEILKSLLCLTIRNVSKICKLSPSSLFRQKYCCELDTSRGTEFSLVVNFMKT